MKAIANATPVGHMEAQDYAKKAYQWAKALRLLDPNIKIIACGGKERGSFTCGSSLTASQRPGMPTGIALC